MFFSCKYNWVKKMAQIEMKSNNCPFAVYRYQPWTSTGWGCGSRSTGKSTFWPTGTSSTAPTKKNSSRNFQEVGWHKPVERLLAKADTTAVLLSSKLSFMVLKTFSLADEPKCLSNLAKNTLSSEEHKIFFRTVDFFTWKFFHFKRDKTSHKIYFRIEKNIFSPTACCEDSV